jgi:hypothetical protein
MSSYLNRLFFSVFFLIINACTTVSITPINYNGEKVPNGIEGLPFFRPKPYLLVLKSPKIKHENNQNLKSDENQAEGDTEENTNNSTLLFKTENYLVKLIYLPDFSHGYTISISNPWRPFGSTEMSPQLENGWMLKSLNSKVDSKTPETLTAIASIVAAARNGATPIPGNPTFESNWSNSGLPDNSEHTVTEYDLNQLGVLKPGLYEFKYIDGVLVDLELKKSFI